MSCMLQQVGSISCNHEVLRNYKTARVRCILEAVELEAA